MLLNETDRASESGGSTIFPLTLSFTFGLNRPRLGDQPQNVLPLPLKFRRRFGHDVGSFAVGGVFVKFSLEVGDVVVVKTESDDVDDDLRRRLVADRESFSGVATLPKGAGF